MSWQESENGLERTLEFPDFAAAFAFMTRVAAEAEAMNHHPDMCISWNKVSLQLVSHDAGSTVTDRDRALAARIDAVIEG